MTSLSKLHPLSSMYSLVQYQSCLLTLIREKTQPPYFLNMAYLMSTKTCGCTPTISKHTSQMCLLVLTWLALSHMTQYSSNFLRFILKLDTDSYIFYHQTEIGQMSTIPQLIWQKNLNDLLVILKRTFSKLKKLTQQNVTSSAFFSKVCWKAIWKVITV